MYNEYASSMELDHGGLYYDEPEQAADTQFLGPIRTLLLGSWVVISLFGFAIIFLADNTIAGIVVIAIPTFIGMVISTKFALAIMMLTLPTGAGIGLLGGQGVTYASTFSLDRGVGLALAAAFALNVMITRPKLRIDHRVLWVVGLYTLCILGASLTGRYFSVEFRMGRTQVQLMVLALIVYWILQNHGENAYRWALRSYVVGTVGMILLTFVTGTAIRSMEGQGRYTATLGRAIDANMLAAITVMAFLAALYLFGRDKHIFWRLIYGLAIVLMPVMMLRIGSRGALVALIITMCFPLLFLRQIQRRPGLTLLLVFTIFFASALTLVYFKTGQIEEGVGSRLTDVGYAKQSIGVRMEPIRKAVSAGLTRPFGTSHFAWFDKTGARIWPHNDFFLILGTRGLVCASLFALIIVMAILVVRRTPLSLEKLYSRAVLTFLIVMGMNIGQAYKKYFWVFLAIVLASERIAWLHMNQTKPTVLEIDEETSDNDY